MSVQRNIIKFTIVYTKKVTYISFYWFIKQYGEGRLSQADSITRQSRLLQETHPELRGERRGNKELQQEVVEDIMQYKSERTQP